MTLESPDTLIDLAKATPVVFCVLITGERILCHPALSETTNKWIGLVDPFEITSSGQLVPYLYDYTGLRHFVIDISKLLLLVPSNQFWTDQYKNIQSKYIYDVEETANGTIHYSS